MIQPFEHGRERPLDIRKVHQPTRPFVDVAFTDELDPEAVPVQSGTLVTGWSIG